MMQQFLFHLRSGRKNALLWTGPATPSPDRSTTVGFTDGPETLAYRKDCLQAPVTAPCQIDTIDLPYLPFRPILLHSTPDSCHKCRLHRRFEHGPTIAY